MLRPGCQKAACASKGKESRARVNTRPVHAHIRAGSHSLTHPHPNLCTRLLAHPHAATPLAAAPVGLPRGNPDSRVTSPIAGDAKDAGRASVARGSAGPADIARVGQRGNDTIVSPTSLNSNNNNGRNSSSSSSDNDSRGTNRNIVSSNTSTNSRSDGSASFAGAACDLAAAVAAAIGGLNSDGSPSPPWPTDNSKRRSDSEQQQESERGDGSVVSQSGESANRSRCVVAVVASQATMVDTMVLWATSGWQFSWFGRSLISCFLFVLYGDLPLLQP
jgi:hypothetical protein